jgi:microcompartment protein CcmL/EutN
VEVSYYANAVYLLDVMVKASQVKFLTAEKRLGGRLVTLIVGGSTSQVNSAVDAVKAAGENLGGNLLKAAIAISNPHLEILKFIPGSFKEETENEEGEKSK